MNWSLLKCSFKKNRYHYDNNKQKNFEIGKIRILRYQDLLLKVRYQELIVWCLASDLREK